MTNILDDGFRFHSFCVDTWIADMAWTEAFRDHNMCMTGLCCAIIVRCTWHGSRGSSSANFEDQELFLG